MSRNDPFRAFGYEVDPRAEQILGRADRLISHSKSDYRKRHPDHHVAVFNANVCLAAGKVWHGDLSLTLEEPKLLGLAAELGETVYVLHERDGRFEHAAEPLLDRAVYSVTPDGHTRFRHKWIERARDGTLRYRSPVTALASAGRRRNPEGG